MPGRSDLTDGSMFMNGNLWKFWMSAESAKVGEMDLTGSGARVDTLSPRNLKYNGNITDRKWKNHIEFMKNTEMHPDSVRVWESKVYQARHVAPHDEGQIRDNLDSMDSAKYLENKITGVDNSKWSNMEYRNKIRDDMDKFSQSHFDRDLMNSECYDKKDRPDMTRSLSYSTDRVESRSHITFRDQRSHSSYIPNYKVCYIIFLNHLNLPT